MKIFSKQKKSYIYRGKEKIKVYKGENLYEQNTNTICVDVICIKHFFASFHY